MPVKLALVGDLFFALGLHLGATPEVSQLVLELPLEGAVEVSLGVLVRVQAEWAAAFI